MKLTEAQRHHRSRNPSVRKRSPEPREVDESFVARSEITDCARSLTGGARQGPDVEDEAEVKGAGAVIESDSALGLFDSGSNSAAADGDLDRFDPIVTSTSPTSTSPAISSRFFSPPFRILQP